MRKTLNTFALTALAVAGQTANAHPSFWNGATTKHSVTTNTAAGPVTSNLTSVNTRGLVEGVRIAHGCALTADEPGATVNGAGWEKPVAAQSWIFPTGQGIVYKKNALGAEVLAKVRRTSCGDAHGVGAGEKVATGGVLCLEAVVLDNGLAPWSTTSTGTDPTIGFRPAVARITNMANDGKDATKVVDASGNVTNPAAYIGIATTLGAELTDASGNPITTLRGMLTPLGNAPYFRTFKNNAKIDGFWTTNPIKNPATGQYVGVDYSSASLPAKYANAIQIGALGNLKFAAGSCARRLVIRPAAMDVCTNSADSGVDLYPDAHHVNTWMGGRTTKFKVGDAGQQNNWSASLTLLNRDTTAQPYSGCTDNTNGDYDLVVMPTHYEINTYLPFPAVKGTGTP